jgi:hypothetical protein
MKKLLTTLTVLQCGWSLATFAQGTFQNLNFEAATFPGAPIDAYGRYAASDATPGWTAYVGTSLEPLILHDNVFLDSAGIGIFDTECTDPLIIPYCRVLDGNYSVFLQAGRPLFGGSWTSASIAQTGLVPSGMRTMAFLSLGAFGSDPAPNLQVSLGGQETPLQLMSAQPSYNLYGVDVSAYGGQTTEIKFTANGQLYLDSIRFTPIPVPEPVLGFWVGVTAVLALGRLGRHGGNGPRGGQIPQIQA